MAPKTTKQFDTIRKDRKDQIMKVALELFSSEGINTPISKIAKQAGISKGLMYNYFDSKNDLLREVALMGMTEIFDIFDPNHDGILTDEEYVFFIDEMFNKVTNNRTYWQLYFSMMVQPKVMELIKDDVMKIFMPLMKIQMNYFASKGSKDPETDTMFFNAMMDGVVMNYVSNPTFFNLDKIKKLIIETFIKI